jgi:hypothetical protein
MKMRARGGLLDAVVNFITERGDCHSRVIRFGSLGVGCVSAGRREGFLHCGGASEVRGSLTLCNSYWVKTDGRVGVTSVDSITKVRVPDREGRKGRLFM